VGRVIPNCLLEINEIVHIIKSLYENYKASFEVEGGEFFLRRDIKDLFSALSDRYWSNITITTNGTVGIDVRPEYLCRLDEFRVSVEGHTDDLQRDIRNISLKPVLKTCENLRSSGVPITLRVTLHKKNYKFLSEMLDYFNGLGFTRFSMYEFQAVGRGRAYADEYVLDKTELGEVLRELISYSVSAGIETLKLSLSARRISLLTDYEQKLIASGYKILDLSNALSLTINYNGDLGVCPWIVNTDVIGKYQEQNFISNVAKYIANGLLEHDCQHCSAVRVEWQTAQP